MNNNSAEGVIRKFLLLYIISVSICNYGIINVLMGEWVRSEFYAPVLFCTVVGIVPTAVYLFFVLAKRTDILSSKPNAKKFLRVFMYSGIATAVYFLFIYFVFFYEKGIFRSELAGLVKDYMQYSVGVHLLDVIVCFSLIKNNRNTDAKV